MLYAAKSRRIVTRWAKQVVPERPLPEYPRPRLTRPDWLNLNGPWDYALTGKDGSAPPSAFDGGTIVVPFPYESALSGVNGPSIPDQRLWCRRTFVPPAAWRGQRLLLHFGAVNWDCTVFVNGRPVGAHQGGFASFSFDITDALRADGGANDLVVSAWNPLRTGVPDATVTGKQRVKPGGIFYTAATGIWQTVWLEPVPAAGYLRELRLTPDFDAGAVRVRAVAPAGWSVRVSVDSAAAVEGPCNAGFNVPLAEIRRWSPDDPYLYAVRAELWQDGGIIDRVDSYFGLRKIALGPDAQGRTCILLNGEFVFGRGVLDQGYWPDGVYTAPTDAALRSDLEMTRKLGFNLSRKHAKVEPQRWYYHADQLGLLVWQDMPQMFNAQDGPLTDGARAQFEREWRELLPQLGDHPSIVAWTLFNEAWGQHDTERLAALTRALDPTRLLNSVSGWIDQGVGDLHDTHSYPVPNCAPAEPARATVCGEFGGIGLRQEGHMWNTQSWGYQGLAQGAWHATKRYRELLEVAYRLRDERAMSACVYTQLTDVESESNGLLTYDRAVLKLDATLVAAANRGEFPPMPPNPAPDIMPTAQDDPVEWRYTTAAPREGWAQTGFDDGGWQTGRAGFGHTAQGVRTEWTTPDIWLRRQVTLPAAAPLDRLIFRVYHDESAEIYLNGVLAATASGMVDGYVRVPLNPAGRAAWRRDAENTVAVHCRQRDGGQFIDVGIGLDLPAAAAGR